MEYGGKSSASARPRAATSRGTIDFGVDATGFGLGEGVHERPVRVACPDLLDLLVGQPAVVDEGVPAFAPALRGPR